MSGVCARVSGWCGAEHRPRSTRVRMHMAPWPLSGSPNVMSRPLSANSRGPNAIKTTRACVLMLRVRVMVRVMVRVRVRVRRPVVGGVFYRPWLYR